MQRFYEHWATLPGNIKGSLIILLTSLIAVVMGSFIKHVGQSIPVVEILFIRQILVLIIILPVIVKNFDSVFTTTVMRFHFLRGFLSISAMFAAFTAIVYLPLAEVTAISFMRIVFTTILAIVFLKEIVGIRRWISVIIGFIGVLIIARPDTEGLNIYAVYAMVSACLVSGISIVMRKLSQVENPSTIMAYQSLIVTLGMAGPAIYLWVPPTYDEAILILIIGGLMSLMQWLYIQAFKVGEAAAIAPTEYSRLIFAIIIGFIFFAEIPTLWTLSGSGIIIASTLYTMHRERLKKSLPETI
ncbi:MAG: DMT family transporter [Halopseudomonas sp.]